MYAARPGASLIYNPKAGRRAHGQTIAAIKEVLDERYHLAVTPTSGPRDAIQLARKAGEGEGGAVFAWGGDGTVREVVEGILGAPIALGVLPGGTFNVVALAVGLPQHDPVAAARMLTSARPQARDVGLLGDFPFLMQATAGFDGYVIKKMRPEIKAKYGIPGAIGDAFRALLSYRFPVFDVEVDGKPFSITGAAFVNMSEYAGRHQFVPGARWDDRKAHVLLYRGRSRLAAASFGLSLAMGRHHLRKDVTILPAETLTIKPCEGVYLQADGESWTGSLPVTCRLADDQINVLIP